MVIPRVSVECRPRNENLHILEEYKPLISFKEIDLGFAEQGLVLGAVGGEPVWRMEDETPSALDDGQKLDSIFQLNMNFEYTLVDGAPRELVIDLFEGAAESTENYYRLFIGNEIYVFVNAEGEPYPYVITQVD